MTPKRGLQDLARFGGQPLFDRPRHVNRPGAPPRSAFDAYLDRAWDARWFTNDGPLAQDFESRLAAFLGVGDCVLACNATAALELAIRALGLSGEVIVPAYTFVSTANALVQAGLVPVFCDIDPATLNIDAEDCARRITARTSAVIPTHVWSTPCDTGALATLCEGAGLVLLYDAAHAFAAEHLGRRIGGFGRAEIFSLHATKLLHAFEGGVLATDDADLAADLRQRRNFGFAGPGRVEIAGTNAKLSEAHAAMGLANLDRLDATLAAARRVHDTYAAGLAGIGGLRFRPPAPGSNRHYAVAEIDAAEFGMSRDALVGLLAAENVLARRYFQPGTHRLAAHRQTPPVALPAVEAACARILVLPAGAAIAPDDVAAICELVRFVAAQAGPIAARAASHSSGEPGAR